MYLFVFLKRSLLNLNIASILLCAVTFSLTFLFVKPSSALVVDCVASTSSVTNYVTLMGISSTTNAMVAIDSPFFSTYPVLIQCSNLASVSFLKNDLSSNCTLNGNGNMKLFNISVNDTTNLHVEDRLLSNYSRSACLMNNNGDFDIATVTTKMNNCDGYGTTLFSAPATFSTTGNTHIGDPSTYPMKVCLTLILKQALTVTFSSQSAGFGTLSSGAVSYATTDGLGTTTAPVATSSLFFDVNVSGNVNYVVSVQGQTLTNNQNSSTTIASIGATPVTPSPGSDQFGISVLAKCITQSNGALCDGNGFSSRRGGSASSTIAYPYNTSGYAYAATATTSSLVANGVNYDSITYGRGTRYQINLAASIAANKPAGKYTSNLVFIVTPEF